MVLIKIEKSIKQLIINFSLKKKTNYKNISINYDFSAIQENNLETDYVVHWTHSSNIFISITKSIDKIIVIINIVLSLESLEVSNLCNFTIFFLGGD